MLFKRKKYKEHNSGPDHSGGTQLKSWRNGHGRAETCDACFAGAADASLLLKELKVRRVVSSYGQVLEGALWVKAAAAAAAASPTNKNPFPENCMNGLKELVWNHLQHIQALLRPSLWRRQTFIYSSASTPLLGGDRRVTNTIHKQHSSNCRAVRRRSRQHLMISSFESCLKGQSRVR